ncbi:MAG: hypothetical protein IPL75_09110 [Acidobacteria bacterium]|nr:hypothetical protein [Acidobacteriota bacterium]
MILRVHEHASDGARIQLLGISSGQLGSTLKTGAPATGLAWPARGGPVRTTANVAAQATSASERARGVVQHAHTILIHPPGRNRSADLARPAWRRIISPMTLFNRFQSLDAPFAFVGMLAVGYLSLSGQYVIIGRDTLAT